MVAFGGANLDLMIITTAYVQDGHEQELDGCLLALETGYQGMPEPVFELSIDLQKTASFTIAAQLNGRKPGHDLL